ncbi:MAG TPA: protein kinase [Bryobacteraceae bacterium]|nr:protein kinase [Bryobacteraceae bacterium]
MSLEAGTQLGDYRILSTIGSGAYGEVYEAEHTITRRRDALKILADRRLHAPEEERRFLQEIQLQASLHHPNIAAVHNAFSTPHGLALVMELVPGEPLSAVLARGRIPIDRGTALVLEMLAALAYAHAVGVVHRDIKPENIIVTPEGSVKLTDFGLARCATSPRITQSGAFAGSPCYMSPEQARGTQAADSRSDTYSAGVVLYEVVTGRLPFTGDSTFEVLLAHQYSPPPPPDEVEPAAGAALSQVILTAIEKEPDRRYQTAGAFYTALESAAGWTAAETENAPRNGLLPIGLPHISLPHIGLPRNRMTLAACACVLLGAATFSAVELYPKTAPPADTGSTADTSGPAQPVSIAVPAAPEPAKPAVPAESASIPNSNPVAQPPLRLPGRARVAEPSPVALHFTGSVPDAPGPAPNAGVSTVRMPAPSRPDVTPGNASPGPSVVAPAVSPPQSTPVTESDETSPAAPVEPDTGKPPPKRRNVVLRVLQKVFHPHPKATVPDPSPKVP